MIFVKCNQQTNDPHNFLDIEAKSVLGPHLYAKNVLFKHNKREKTAIILTILLLVH